MITVANTITISDRDAYLTDYEWEISDGVPIVRDLPRAEHVPQLRRPSMLSNILMDLGINFRGFNDGNPLNLCRSNLLPVSIRKLGGRWCVLDGGRRVVSESTREEAEQARKIYYDG